MTGMSGSGKSTLAKAIKSDLLEMGYRVEIVDGDEYRSRICPDLGFSKEHRVESVRRLSFVAKVLAENGVVVLMSVINPYEDLRSEISSSVENSRVVYMKCSVESLIKRDPKGLYARALLPEGDPMKIHDFTGISSEYEVPHNPDFIVDTEVETINECKEKLLNFMLKELAK